MFRSHIFLLTTS